MDQPGEPHKLASCLISSYFGGPKKIKFLAFPRDHPCKIHEHPHAKRRCATRTSKPWTLTPPKIKNKTRFLLHKYAQEHKKRPNPRLAALASGRAVGWGRNCGKIGPYLASGSTGGTLPEARPPLATRWPTQCSPGSQGHGKDGWGGRPQRTPHHRARKKSTKPDFNLKNWCPQENAW